MAKRLEQTVKKSSMSRFLDNEALEGALSAKEEGRGVNPGLLVVETKATSEVKPVKPPLKAKKPELIRGGELYLTTRTRDILDDLLGTFKQNTHRGIAATHILRGILLALQPHLAKVREEVEFLGPQKRPANESQYALDREEFERKLGETILKAVRG